MAYKSNYKSKSYAKTAPNNLIYFISCKTKQDVKLLYRQLAKKFHPDIIGKTEENEKRMKDINAEYEALKNILPNEVMAEDNNEQEQTEEEFTFQVSQEMKEILDNISHLPFDIEIIGSWIWVSGNTFPYRSYLTAYNFTWCPSKKMYSWHMEKDSHKWHSKPQDIEKIRFNYGSTKVNNANRQAIQ